MEFEDFLQDLPSLDVINKDNQKISVKLKGVPLQYANALRRICLNGVPIFAIDGFSAYSANFAQIGASFLIDAFFRSLAIRITT